MTTNDAVAILREYQEWRRYNGAVGEGPKMIDPKVIGEALDVVCDALEGQFKGPKKWHNPNELPANDTEVIAQYDFPYANYVVVKYDNGYWWQHLPPMPPVIPDGGWFGIDESAILRWAYIREEER